MCSIGTLHGRWSALVGVVAHRHGLQGKSPTFLGEGLGTHKDQAAIAGEDVGQRRWHIEPARVGLRIFSRRLFIEDRFRQHIARHRIETPKVQPSVEEDGPSGHEIGDAFLDQHVAVDRPDRLDLFEGGEPLVGRSRKESPTELAVCRSQAIDIAVGRSEEDETGVVGGRRVDACSGGELPFEFPRLCIEGHDGVRIDGGEVEPAVGNDRAAELTADVCLPSNFQGGGNRGSCLTATTGVLTVGGPVVGPCFDRWICW